MVWTNLTFVECSILTASKMTGLQENFLALAAGTSGAPPIAVNSLVWSGQASGASLDLSSGFSAPGVSSLGAVSATSGFMTPAVSSLGTLHLSGGQIAPEVSCFGTVHASSGFIATGVMSLAAFHAESGFVGPQVSSYGSLEVSSAVKIAGAAASPPATNTIYRENICRGWISFNGIGTIAINDSFNVASITDNGTGDYTVTWDTDFADANYATIVSTLHNGGVANGVAGVKSTGGIAVGSVVVSTSALTGVKEDKGFISVAAYGAQ